MKVKNEEVAMLNVMKFEGEAKRIWPRELAERTEEEEILDDDIAYCLQCDEEQSLREALENEEGDRWWDEGVDLDEE